MRLLSFFLILLPAVSIAQKVRTSSTPQLPSASCSTIPGMTPQTAIPVCGALTFHQVNVSSCTGSNIPNPTCGSFTSDNSFWYKFHCYSAGVAGLGFLITPDSGGDDYDWGLFDVTGHTDLNDIFSMVGMQVSINVSGELTGGGVTGCTATGSGNLNCAGVTPLFNRLAPMVAGNDYVLMVTNWSNSGLGYNLSFAGGDAVITDNTLPVINNVAAVGCNNALLRVVFSTDIRCTSVTSSGSEFSVMPAAPAISNVTSQCDVGFNSITELNINFATPLPAGNYTLNVGPGSDGNTFKDACDQDMLTGFSIPFTIVDPTPLTVSNIAFTGCAPTVLNVALSAPAWCTSITGSGSEFSILPGNPAIASVQSSCGANPYTNNFQIVLQNPLPYGNYQLRINNGSDGNTLIDTCNGTIANGTTIPFVIPQTTVAPIIQSIGFDECHPDEVVLNFDKPVNCLSLTATGSEFSISPGSFPINSVLSNCGANSYTSQVTLILQNPLTAGNYAVNVNGGSDGNSLSDTCYSFIAAGYSKNFSATQAPVPVFDSIQYDRCDPTSVKVFYSHPIFCNSISPDGSDFTITGPSAVSIASATTDVTCAQGYSNWVLLQLTSPISVFGAYTLHNGIGSDANGIIDTCNAKQNIAETFPIDALLKPSPVFTSQVNWGCSADTIILSHPGGNGINSWTWICSNGTTGSGQNVSLSFPVTVPSIDVKLIVSNGYCSDSSTQTITLGNNFKAAFTNTPVDTTCMGVPVNFTDASTGTSLASNGPAMIQ